MSGESPKFSEDTLSQTDGDDDDILQIEELQLPARALTIGAQGLGRAQRQYELIAGIAKGGMGEIFLANMSQPNQSIQQVIVKRLLAQLRNDSDQLAMFRAEAEVMHRLDHPNIVAIIDDPIIDDTPCLAMEYVRGRNIDQVLARSAIAKKSLPIEGMLYVMIEVLRGLAHVHTATLENGEPLRLVHRDITPGNLILSFEGEIKITDFGISKSQMSRVSTTVGIVKGKARYLSPEQIVGEPATTRSDLFACACVGVELITGHPLFNAPNVHKTLHSIVNGKREKVSDLFKTREPTLINAIEKALCTDPKKRFANATEFCDALQRAQAACGSRFGKRDLAEYLQDLFKGCAEHWEKIRIPAPSGVIKGEPSQTDANLKSLSDDTPLSPPPAGSKVSAQSNKPKSLITESVQTKLPDETLQESEPVQGNNAHDEDETKVGLVVQSGKNIEAQVESQTAASVLPESFQQRARRPKSFDSGFKFKRSWPILFATFGLGLASGVIATISIIEEDNPQTVPPIIEQQAPTERATEDQESPEQLPPSIPSAPPQSIPSPPAPEPKPIAAVPKPRKGTLSVYGPKGARIYVDGKRIRRRTPLIAYPLSSGRHRIQISKGNYRRSATVNIRASKKSTLKFKKRRRSKKR